MELVSKKEKKILANIDSEIQSFPKNVINRVLFSTLLVHVYLGFYIRLQFPLRDNRGCAFRKMNRSRACQITTEISLEKESSSYEKDVKRAWKRFDQIFLKRTCNSLDKAIFAFINCRGN